MKEKYLRELLDKRMTRKEFLRHIAVLSFGALMYKFLPHTQQEAAEHDQGETMSFGTNKFGV